MSDKINIAELKQNTDIVQVIGRYVALKKVDANEWKGICPFHNEKSPSFTVTPKKNLFKCFGCGKGGDVIDFLVESGRTFQEALKEIQDPNNTAAVPHGEKTGVSKKLEKTIEWKQIIPAVRADGMYHHYKHGLPSQTWDYVDEKGKLICCVCRFDLPDGKQVLPLIYATDGKRNVWRFQGSEKPRPLRNLDHISRSDDDVAVVVFEGEKTSKAGEKLFPNTISTNWIGGTAGVKHTNWKPLKGKTVVLWPDNDEPGFEAMHEVHDQIKKIAKEIKWVINPPDAAKGWDIADSAWTPAEAKKYSSSNVIDYPGREFQYETRQAQNGISWDIGVLEKDKEKKGKKKTTPVIKLNAPPVDPPKKWTAYPLKGEGFFRMLGAQKEGNGMIYFFYAFASKTVIGLSPAGMTKNNLMQLAPLDWWANEFPDDKYAFSLETAVDYLVNKSSEFGTFSDKKLRGRGAWMDGKHVVIHAGDKLFVDGKETAFSDFKSKYIYEVGEDLDFSTNQPINKKDASKLVDLVNLLSWERPINAYLFIGWCIVAPVCGALNWRPHIWLTGGTGTGKSTIFKDIVRPLLGEAGLAVQGETSEAGLRQTLGHDALPVVFDEAEGEDRKAQDRMQSVMALMRASSANDGGIMAKGSAGGSAKTYRIRSCFAFASIAVQVAQQADRTRVSVLGLLNADNDAARGRWKQFLSNYSEFFTSEYCNGIRARTIALLPTILANVKTFSTAAASEIGEQRAGDQIGVLLAGAYSLTSDDIISYEKAVEWVKTKDWTEEKNIRATSDENSLLSFLLEQLVRIETSHATVERTVGELVLYAMNLKSGGYAIADSHANERLKRMGMKVEGDNLVISNSDVNLTKMLAPTSWAKNHNKILMRLSGAEALESVRFSAGVKSRAVQLHKDIVFKNIEPEKVAEPTTAVDAASELSKPVNDPFGKQEDLPF